jgi:hypothetical protein
MGRDAVEQNEDIEKMRASSFYHICHCEKRYLGLMPRSYVTMSSIVEHQLTKTNFDLECRQSTDLLIAFNDRVQ